MLSTKFCPSAGAEFALFNDNSGAEEEEGAYKDGVKKSAWKRDLFSFWVFCEENPVLPDGGRLGPQG